MYHIYTLWLFTCQQVIDTVVPVSMFAIGTAVSGVINGLPYTSRRDALIRIPMVSFWLWILLLQFCIHNQLDQTSIDEDAVNKPWRPLPAGRITRAQTKVLRIFTYVVAIAMSSYLNTLPHFLVWTALTVMYNELGGSDGGALCRNGLSASGFLCLFTGSLKIASQADAGLSKEAYQWVLLIDFVLFSTVQSSEFRDEEGDRARGRLTIITTIGKTPARWSLIAAILFWSFYVPAWFGVGFIQALLPVALGMLVAGMNVHGFRKSSASLDGVMYKLWSVWMLGCCSMPLLKANIPY